MTRKPPNKIIIRAARDGETGEVYCLDLRNGLYLLSASTAKALLRKLRPIVRADDPETEIALKIVTDSGPRWPSEKMWR